MKAIRRACNNALNGAIEVATHREDDHFWTMCLLLLLLMVAHEKYHEWRWWKANPEAYHRHKREMAYYSRPPTYHQT